MANGDVVTVGKRLMLAPTESAMKRPLPTTGSPGAGNVMLVGLIQRDLRLKAVRKASPVTSVLPLWPVILTFVAYPPHSPPFSRPVTVTLMRRPTEGYFA